MLPKGALIWLALIWLISPNRATHLKSPKNTFSLVLRIKTSQHVPVHLHLFQTHLHAARSPTTTRHQTLCNPSTKNTVRLMQQKAVKGGAGRVHTAPASASRAFRPLDLRMRTQQDASGVSRCAVS